MKNLFNILQEAVKEKKAIGHFNISDLAGLKAIFEAAYNLKAPIMIGVSEGERDFIGVRQVSALIRSLREEYNYPIFLNADHTHSLQKAKEAALAGFDAILFDGGRLSLDENIKQTKEAVSLIKNINADILVEGEIGYIGSSSTILEDVPSGVAIKGATLTQVAEAEFFVRETRVDLLAPAVGNLHGILKNAPQPCLDITRIRELKNSLNIPLVLHGGSGINDEDFVAAIDAGIAVIHINTELRLAWRRGLEKAFAERLEEITPYKLLPEAIKEIKQVVEKRLLLFNRKIL
jgi:fructose-bisphosphate aldolase class II